jgi:hypothetical protein
MPSGIYKRKLKLKLCKIENCSRKHLALCKNNSEHQKIHEASKKLIKG